jgi:hypothetical protein
MKRLNILAILLVAVMSMAVFADTKSDYDHRYDMSKLRSWDFKSQKMETKDHLGDNDLWDKRVRKGLEEGLMEKGFAKAERGGADFLVSYRLATKEKVETRYIDNRFPRRYSRFGYGRGWGWRRGWDWDRDLTVWRIPYTESTLVVDIIDAKTNQLIWRGYDTETIDFKKSEKTINKSVEDLVKRFAKDVKENEEE